MNDGLLLIDKPEGLTSHDVVDHVRRKLSRKDVGHAGTLDPLATGLLVLLIGNATKLSDFILNGDKAYETTLQLGIETDTDDKTGNIIKTFSQTLDFSKADYEKIISELSGSIELPVPIYSAIKIKGQKLYHKAREGQVFTPPLKTMEFRNIQILESHPDQLKVHFDCSKGSYVRSWVKAIGQKLGCGATVTSLRRTNSNPYSVVEAISWPEFVELSPESLYQGSSWIPLKKSLPSWPSLKIEGFDEKLISNGQISRRLHRFLELEYGQIENLEGVKLLSRRSGELVSLLSYNPPLNFKIRRVFHNQ